MTGDTMAIITCALPLERRRYRPDPFPGSEDAWEEGCTCPLQTRWPGFLQFSSDCPVHALEVATN
jgi:hypothetical protein